MCRMTLIYPKTDKMDHGLNLMLLSNFMNLNSADKQNVDGSGIAIVGENTTKVYKDVIPGYDFTSNDYWWSILEDEKEILKNSKLIGHVRQATQGVKIETANSHPFVVGSLVAMHNGSIRNKDEFAKDINSDSLSWFTYLSQQSENKPITYPLLKDSLEKIRGAFCMLINDRSNSSPDGVWVIVGKNRELHILENDDVIIINTAKDSFKCVDFIRNDLRTLGDERWKLLTFDEEVKKLPQETIFFVDKENGMVSYGDVKENDTYVTTVYSTGRVWTNANVIEGNFKRSDTNETIKECQMAAEVYSDILSMILMYYGESKSFIQRALLNKQFEDWAELTLEELQYVFRFIQFLHENHYLDDAENKQEVWDKMRKIIRQNNKSNKSMYEILRVGYPELQFPFWLNEKKFLDEILEVLQWEGIL